jgi:hypothetical protein
MSSIDNFDEEKENEISTALMKTCWKLFKEEDKNEHKRNLNQD